MVRKTYTHNFIYRIGDGGSYMSGEVQFSRDKKSFYRLKSWSEPISHDMMIGFISFMDKIKEGFDGFDGIKNIQIVEKNYKESIKNL